MLESFPAAASPDVPASPAEASASLPSRPSATPSAATARRRSQQVHKLARTRLDRQYADFWAGRTPPGDDLAEVMTLAAGASDKVLAARARLLGAMCQVGLQPPRDLLDALGEVLPVFEAAVMVRERTEALLLAVRCLIDAGDASAALDMLARAEPVTAADGPEGELRRTALRALAWLDLGRADDAEGAAAEVRARLDAARGLPVRLVADLTAACAEVALSQRLASCGVETHLSLGASRQRRRPVQGAVAATLPTMPALPSGDSAVTLVGALALIDLAARDPSQEQVLVRLATLVAHLANHRAPPAQAWLCVGTAYRLAGHLKPAVRSLEQAIEVARPLGLWRVACHALFERSLIEARRQDFAAAYAAMAELHGAARGVPRTLGARGWWAAPVAAAEPAPPAVGAGGHRTASMHVRRASAYIRDHLGARLTVSDVARACNVSRRTLEVAFRSELQTSVADFVRDLRLQTVAQRLSNTQLPIKRIAHDLGYGSASSLSRDFRRATGCPPAEYRLRAAVR